MRRKPFDWTLFFTIAIIVIIPLGLLLILLATLDRAKSDPVESDRVNIAVSYREEESTIRFKLKNITVTAYTNSTEETDSSPNITATNRAVYEGSVAVSQDLWNKRIFAGDRICIEKEGKCYIAEDCMHSRFTRKLDIFMYDKSVAKNVKYISNIVVFRTLN